MAVEHTSLLEVAASYCMQLWEQKLSNVTCKSKKDYQSEMLDVIAVKVEEQTNEGIRTHLHLDPPAAVE